MPSRQTVFKFCTKRGKVKSLRRELDIFNQLAAKAGKTPPGIVEVIAAHDDEAPYYIQLEYVKGGDLKRWIDEHGKDAPLRVRLDLAIQLARALARIHEAGFVHRDVKPSNYLVEPADDPGRAPTLKLSDFGIGQEAVDAALGHREGQEGMAGGGARYTMHTQTLLQAAGAYFFIAPELVISSASTPGKVAKRAQTAADLYSLGVTLYQLFAGDTQTIPGPGLRAIADPILREDIEACLAETPENRPSAEELIQGLERYEDRRAEAEEAERARLAAQTRRARRIIAAISALLLLSIVGVVTSGILFGRAENLKQLIEEELAHSNLLLAQTYSNRGAGFAQARKKLWEIPEKYRHWEWGFLLNKVSPHLLSLEGHLVSVSIAQFSPDGRRIVTASEDGAGKVWDAQSGKELFSLEGHSDSVSSAQFSPDGRRILTASGDKTAKLWDAQSGTELLSLEGHSAGVLTAQFSPDGRRIMASDDKTAKVWTAAPWRLEDLPGDESMTWKERFQLWKWQEYEKQLKSREAASSPAAPANP